MSNRHLNDLQRLDSAIEHLRELAPSLSEELAIEVQAQLNELEAVSRRLAAASRAVTWPTLKDVKRPQDMGPGHLRVVLDGDNDAIVEVWNGERSAAVEFCNPGGCGGGRSRETRRALIGLMVAMEADNAGLPLVSTHEDSGSREA